MVYPADEEGRLVLQPDADYDNQNLHWSVRMRALLPRLWTLIAFVAYYYTMIRAQPRRRVSAIAPLPADISVSKLRTNQWFWLAGLVALFAIYPWTAPTESIFMSASQHLRHGRVRELLGIATFEDGVIWWWATCGGFGVLAAASMMLHYRQQTPAAFPTQVVQVLTSYYDLGTHYPSQNLKLKLALETVRHASTFFLILDSLRRVCIRDAA